MRIRTVLLLAFLLSTILPTVIFGWWSYNQSLKREFSEVTDRHLLLAQNLGAALKRYNTDLVATFEAISAELMAGKTHSGLGALMTTLRITCVLIVDAPSGAIVARIDANPVTTSGTLPGQLLQTARTTVEPGKTSFSHVLPGGDHGNILLGVRQYGDQLAVALVNTQYFIDLGQQISFGKRGHAAIVDKAGNVLAHPLADWVASRKNIAGISAVSRMMNGETGIEQFYSPAMKGDMIAGLTSVAGPGWGVMIPQPVEEIYAKVRENIVGIFFSLGAGLAIAIGFLFLFVNSLVKPLEQLLQSIRRNTDDEKLSPSKVDKGIINFREIEQFNSGYNAMVSRVSDANEKITTLAFTDSVTGLPYRKKFEEQAGRVLANCDPKKGSGIVVFIDFDGFKQINDLYGHGTGDRFLRDCAKKLVNVVQLAADERPAGRAGGFSPVVARLGGDEFVILFPGIKEIRDIKDFLKRVQNELSTPSEVLDETVRCSASLGCSRYPHDGTDLDSLVKFADIAMYHAKRMGKNRFELYSPEVGKMTPSEMCIAVDKAIEDGHFLLEYQPKVCANDKKILGVEALVRWKHPDQGRLMPDQWMPIIAHSPVMKRLGEWVIARAMDDHRQWTRDGLNLTVAVNIGAEHFSDRSFTSRLARTSKQKGFDPKNMEIEITEDTLFSPGAVADRILLALHRHGFKVSIDDFGTGYSNIARLSHMQVDFLKIDKSIISYAHNDKRAANMMDGIVMMARTLGCKTVAEGVENQGEVDFLARHKIDILQGFYFAKSLSVDKLVPWAREHERSVAAGKFEQKVTNAA
tara:strand:- start:28648 stop:31062 length:2415 start_codon:yes stop_codon:yes gene_type:complete